jgi:indole-3-glycerol phosphate synthase/phosphoribosylanthranilate isomerase
MSSNVLDKIITNKQRELVLRKKLKPLARLKYQLTHSTRSLYDALSGQKAGYIFECKKASPSKGLINPTFDLNKITDIYKNYASAISVLTDNKYFKGSFFHLTKVKSLVQQPVLCKDFFIDTYQVYEARFFGADAILLMLSVLDDQQYKVLADVAKQLDLDVLTEVHDDKEMKRALALDAKIIGVNNRNLKNLSIDLQTTETLMEGVTDGQKKGRLFISESGISNHQQVRKLAPAVDGFLIGSSVMQQEEIENQCKSLIFGKVKICGINTPDIAQQAYKEGAIYGGLIFAKNSIRSVTLEQAIKISQSAPLQYVGVFVNHPIDQLSSIVQRLGIRIVQLHGEEDEAYIRQLKSILPNLIIWKAQGIAGVVTPQQNELISNSIESKGDRKLTQSSSPIDRYLFDSATGNQRGGNGTTFDWSSIADGAKNDVILAGGLSPDNISDASSLGTFALDINSGIEETKGVKSPEKIREIFETLRV